MFDYDNDGWPDIYVANGARLPSLDKATGFENRLFRNNRDGTFGDVTAQAGAGGRGYSMGLAAGDYDNDGNIDLFVAGVGSNTLYRNLGNGAFEDVTARAGVASDGRWSIAAGWFDYDNDGLLDLFVVRYCAWNPATEPYCGLPQMGLRTYCHPKYYAPLPNALYHNEGRGRFRDVSAESGIAAHLGKGMGVAFGDYDADGRTDVFVANDTMPNFLFHNEGGGKFREAALAAGRVAQWRRQRQFLDGRGLPGLRQRRPRRPVRFRLDQRAFSAVPQYRQRAVRRHERVQPDRRVQPAVDRLERRHVRLRQRRT